MVGQWLTDIDLSRKNTTGLVVFDLVYPVALSHHVAGKKVTDDWEMAAIGSDAPVEGILSVRGH